MPRQRAMPELCLDICSVIKGIASEIGRDQSQNFHQDICGEQDQRPVSSTNVELRKCSEELEKPERPRFFGLVVITGRIAESGEKWEPRFLQPLGF